MTETHENYSRKNAENTRVKVKQRKKTVGITLPPKLVKRARKHNLNISRITEQAWLSILDYLESSKPINMSECESISQQHEKPRWPSWLGHRLGKAEVAGSNPARGST
jgi:hypothetical protein